MTKKGKVDFSLDDEFKMEAELIFEIMDVEAMEMLKEVAERSSTVEEFISRVNVGQCPKCGSPDTRDCEDIPGVEDICVGECIACGYRWCLECGEP